MVLIRQLAEKGSLKIKYQESTEDIELEVKSVSLRSDFETLFNYFEVIINFMMLTRV